MHCIGVDVSKQELVTFDGTKERIFPNTQGLEAFSRFLRRSKDALVVFEPTSTYSRRLENDALAESIQARLAYYRVAQKARLAYQNVLEALSQDPAISSELLEEIRRRLDIQYSI